MPILIEPGVVIHQLTVTGWPEVRGKKSFVPVACSCGVKKDVRVDHLKSGKILSCGCARSLSVTTYKNRHGMTESTEYEIWCSMKKRCNNPNNAAYKNYGGRGIKVCERWEVFENFLSDMGPRPAGMSLDRIDNNKGYSPENCRWVERLTQSNNRRNVKTYTVCGVTGTMPELCRHFGMPTATVWARIKSNWDIDRAFTEPVNLLKGRHLVKCT